MVEPSEPGACGNGAERFTASSCVENKVPSTHIAHSLLPPDVSQTMKAPVVKSSKPLQSVDLIDQV